MQLPQDYRGFARRAANYVPAAGLRKRPQKLFSLAFGRSESSARESVGVYRLHDAKYLTIEIDLFSVVPRRASPYGANHMFKRVAAIALILFCVSIAWAILGSTIFMRTYSSDSRLKDRVASSWGSPQGQAPPSAGYNQVSEETASTDSSGTTVIQHQKSQKWISFPIEKSRVNANLAIDYRRKGLLW